MRRLGHPYPPMTHPAIPAFIASLALCVAAPPVAAAASPLDLAGGCAVAGAASLHEVGGPGTGFEATRLEVTVPGPSAQPAPSLRAARLHATAQGARVRPAQLEQAATAAAAGLLTALAGHRGTPCTDRVLQDAAAPLVQALQQGGRLEFVWQDVALRAGSARFGARRLSLRLDGAGSTAHLAALLDGAVSNDPAAALLPETLAVHASLPAAELPALLSASGGNGAPVEVTIDQADARRGDTTLSGQGRATIAATPEAASGQGHITAHGFDALLDAASGMSRLRTALFLARLVAHRQGDQADWDLVWQGGTLLVNNVPVPLR